MRRMDKWAGSGRLHVGQTGLWKWLEQKRPVQTVFPRQFCFPNLSRWSSRSGGRRVCDLDQQNSALLSVTSVSGGEKVWAFFSKPRFGHSATCQPLANHLLSGLPRPANWQNNHFIG
jgi:hypothetical protein